MLNDVKFRMTIDGNLVDSPQALDIIDPATGAVFGRAPDCTAEQLDLAVAAARAAFGTWKNVDIGERRSSLRRLAAQLEDNVTLLAELLTSEQGKPLSDARLEIGMAVTHFRETAELELPWLSEAGRRVEIQRTPLGVIGAIAPWNFPVVLSMSKVASALLTGNTLILKPSPYTPLTTLKIGELAQSVLPAGVFNVVSGGDKLGSWMTEHEGISKISFTGSVATGRRVMKSAAETLKRVTLELGGNDAAIVFPDADLSHAVEKIFWGAFRNCGQICIAIKRIYVHAEIYEAFKSRLVAYAQGVVVGEGTDPKTRIGPVQNKAQFDRLRELLADCRSAGHSFALGGEFPSDSGGYFFPLTIVDNPPDKSRIVVEEQFGPIVPLLKFSSFEEVVERANATQFGLGNSVWTSDETMALEVASQLESGTVWINDVQRLSPALPFGGHKQSGIGVEGGWEGLLEYTNAKALVRSGALDRLPA